MPLSKRWVKVGMAWLNREKRQIQIKFDSMPIPEYWKEKELYLFETETKGQFVVKYMCLRPQRKREEPDAGE